jgi:hypothetical protein
MPASSLPLPFKLSVCKDTYTRQKVKLILAAFQGLDQKLEAESKPKNGETQSLSATDGHRLLTAENAAAAALFWRAKDNAIGPNYVKFMFEFFY